jgi:hypothetical protein
MTTVCLSGFIHCRYIELDRMCIYLRFTIRGTDGNTLDALNEISDTVEAGEYIIPAKIDGRIGTMHIDGVRDGRRFAEWKTFATYKPIDCPLTQEQLADNEQWAVWCDSQAEKTE